MFFVGGGLVSWASKHQETVALTTVEAEYVVFTRATQQVLWLTKFMEEIRMPQQTPICIFGDNTRAIANTQNDKNHRCTKHINVKHHFVKEKVVMQSVKFNYVLSSENLADILTKPLAKETVVRCCVGIGICG